jgi:hypothetical protein
MTVGAKLTGKRAKKLEKRARQAKRNTLEDIAAEKQKLLDSGLITPEQAAALDNQDAMEEEGPELPAPKGRSTRASSK